MPSPEFADTSYYRRSDVQTARVTVAAQSADADIYGLTFPRAGRVVGGRVVPAATLAANGSNHWACGLINGGQSAGGTAAAAGTVVIASQVGGTAGWTANAPRALTIDGTPTFVAGDVLIVDYDETGTITDPAFTVEVDYVLDQ